MVEFTQKVLDASRPRFTRSVGKGFVGGNAALVTRQAEMRRECSNFPHNLQARKYGSVRRDTAAILVAERHIVQNQRRPCKDEYVVLFQSRGGFCCGC